MRITNIIWDTDGISVDDLPWEVTLDDNIPVEEVADCLSDMYGWCVSSFLAYHDAVIKLYPGSSMIPIKMTIPVPVNRDTEEYIDEYLDGLLSDFVRYNCEWEFLVNPESRF